MEEMCKNVKSASLGSVAGAGGVAAVANIASVVSQETEVFTAPALVHQHNGKGVHFKLAPPTVPSTAAEPVEELLGSVITHNCPGTRASARVIQKMKQDQTRPMTPPPPEKEHTKKEEKPTQKTPSQIRTGNGRTSWTNVERNCFFDALNEFGKDFEAVANCINAKLKRRNANSEYSFKTKDQVRQHYYQTYHKICKYVRYSDELKKLAQELYTLINYGEMRRKLQFLTEKHFMKLKPLIYQGQITIRCKGKNIRIKTPSCKALRRLNQLDDSLEDIRLPSKVEVLLSPANMETFGRVQSLAQNPRGRIIVPLHKKLLSFIKIFEYKWRSSTQRLNEQKSSLYPNISATASNTTTAASTPTPSTNNEPEQPQQQPPAAPVEPSLCFQPKPGVAIHRPLLNITAHLNSIDICLTAYEERIGVKVRSETLGNSAAVAVAASKRPRTESGSEKRSPEAKKPKTGASPVLEKSLDEAVVAPENNNVKLETVKLEDVKMEVVKLEVCSGDELVEDTKEFLPSGEAAIITSAVAPAPPPPPTSILLPQPPATVPASAPVLPVPVPVAVAVPTPPVARSKRKEAKEAAAAAAARNFKPLLSDNIIKRMRRGWTVSNAADITIGDLYVVLGQDSKVELEYYWCETEIVSHSHSSSVPATTTTSTTSATSLPYNTNDCDSVERVKAVTTSTVSNKLKHLLLVANLSERVRKRQCNCGHTCDRKRDLMNKAQQLAGANEAAAAGEGTFRTPMLPVRRPIAHFVDPVRQLSALTRQKLNRQVLVHRRLLLPGSGVGGPGRPYDQLSVRQLHNGLFEPIERAGLTTGIPMSSRFSGEEQRHQHTETDSIQAMDAGASRGPARDMPNLDIVPPSAIADTLPEAAQDESTTQNFFRGSMSPMHLLRDSTSNARWLEENINDFSLTSLLGHLDEIDATRDIIDPSSSMSVISESSVDFRHKFQEIAALLQQQEKD
ncbi:protein cramped [Drosophila miranda]|uniref:protein cramped n=1 Tax=Drosophila miranda TaxID=7229 RepID=UPI0007E74819|nr:protein cramped [Drosophila miranda]